MLTEDLKKQLVERLKSINPNKIVLFGSHAAGKPRKYSDIDLLVVTDDDFVPQNFAEKIEIFLRVSKTITDIGKKMPIDLIVHTKPMHRKFNALGSMFSKKVATNGIVLYEKTD